MKTLSEWNIDVEEIIPPLSSGKEFAANVIYFYLNTDKGRIKIDNFGGEFLGKTEMEAEEKAIKAIRAWIAENNV